MSDDRWSDDQEVNGEPRARLPLRLPRVRTIIDAPIVTADEIFDWLSGTFEPRMGIVRRDPKPAKPAPAAPTGPDLTQAKALAVEFPFSPEQVERVLIVAKRDEDLARSLLETASAMNSPNPGDAIAEVCFGITELKKGTP